MFLEFSQKMLIEYQHDNVQIHGHEYVHLLVSPQVLYVFGTVTRTADEIRHQLCPYLLVAMAMAMSNFEYFGSC